MTDLQPITYRGQLLAVATGSTFILSDDIDKQVDDPAEIQMVLFMCAYAIDVATGHLPGPYSDEQARRYARYCLLAPGVGELLERDNLDVPRAANALGLPAEELEVAVLEHRARLRA